MLSWFEADLDAIIKAVKPGSVTVRAFITGKPRAGSSDGSLGGDDIEKVDSPTKSDIAVGKGRPDVGAIVLETFKNTTGILGVGGLSRIRY